MKMLKPAIAVAALVIALGAAALGSAQPKTPSSGSAAQSGAAPALPADTTDLPSLSKSALPTAKSSPPKPEEWKDAPLVEVSRRSPRARSCRVYLVREYLKVHCAMPSAGVRQLSGPSDDSAMFVVPLKGLEGRPNSAQIIFPVRRDEARLFQFFALSAASYDGFSPESSVVVDAYWPAGEPAPTVVLR